MCMPLLNEHCYVSVCCGHVEGQGVSILYQFKDVYLSVIAIMLRGKHMTAVIYK